MMSPLGAGAWSILKPGFRRRHVSSPWQRMRVRHAELDHSVEDVASDQDLVPLRVFAPSPEATAEHALVAEHGVLGPGLLVLPHLRSPTSAPDLMNPLDMSIVRIPAIVNTSIGPS